MFSAIFKNLFITMIFASLIVSAFGWIGESGMIDQYLPSKNGTQEKVIAHWKNIKDLSEGGDGGNSISLDSDLEYAY